MTTLMEEEPYAAVVKNSYITITCSKCFAWNLDGWERVHLSRCAGCHVLYYCSKACQKRDWGDHKAECKFLRSFPTDRIPGDATRLVFRMLMKNQSQPDFKAFNGRTYQSLMDHCDEYRRDIAVMTTVKRTYAEIQSYMGSKTPSFETVLLAISKKATNVFAIFDGTPGFESRGSGIYLGLSVHNHSCRPDAFVMINGSKLQLRTTKKGCIYSDKLTICYPSGSFFRDTWMRRAHLFSSYLFLCKCEECEDIEADKKRTSGRPTCCPKGWFSLTDLRCNICDKVVPSELGKKAKAANESIRDAMLLYDKLSGGEETFLGFVDGWIKLFDTHKKTLSDENTYLIGIAYIIYNTTLESDLEISLKYANICLPQMRQRPFGLNRTNLLCRRLMLAQFSKRPLSETKEALAEAMESVEVVYGKNHELTQILREKKLEYDLAAMHV